MAKKLDFKDFLTVDYAPGMPGQIKKNAKKRKMDSGAGTNAEYSSTISPEDQIDTIDEVSQELGHKVAKARQAQASNLRQKAVDEPDMMKAFSHTKAANKAEKKAGQTYNRLARKTNEEVEEVDEALSLAQRRALGRRMKLKRRQIELGRKRAMKRAADPKRLKSRAEKAARNAIFRTLSKGKSRSEVTPQRRQEIEKRMEKMKSRIQRLSVKLLPKVRQIDKERRTSKQKEK